MKLAAAVFWWQNRRLLKARGYSLQSFWATTRAYWRSLAEGRSVEADALKQTNDERAGGFSRQQLRARW
jgi:hypothetical protein